MRFFRLSLLSLLGGIAALAPQTTNTAQAAPITYTLTGTGGTGTFAGNAFSGASFTLIGTGDTGAALTSVNGFPARGLTSMTFTITGVTSGAATATSSFFILNANNVVSNALGLTNSTLSEGNTFRSTGAGNWGMTTDLGPLPTTIFGSFVTPTDQGSIRLNNWSSATFSAAVTSAPEPGTLALLALGAGGLVAMRRRQK
jgi:PEP-CTERM motif